MFSFNALALQIGRAVPLSVTASVLTIGLILCQTKDRVLAEYALRDIAKPIEVSAYELEQALPATLASSLPSIKEIEAEFLGEGQSAAKRPDSD